MNMFGSMEIINRQNLKNCLKWHFRKDNINILAFKHTISNKSKSSDDSYSNAKLQKS